MDFWNYELAMKWAELIKFQELTGRLLGTVLVEEAVKHVEPNAISEYQG